MANFDWQKAATYAAAPMSGYMTSMANKRMQETAARNALMKSMMGAGYQPPPGFMQQQGMGGWQRPQQQPFEQPENTYISSVSIDPKGGRKVTYKAYAEKDRKSTTRKPEAQVLTGRAPTPLMRRPTGAETLGSTVPVKEPYFAPKRTGLPKTSITEPASDNVVRKVIKDLLANKASQEEIDYALEVELGVDPEKWRELYHKKPFWNRIKW